MKMIINRSLNNRMLIFIIVGLMPTVLLAQIELMPSVLSSSGGYGENEDFSISWTIGELAITTVEGENLVLTQGFQQPLNIGTSIRKDEITWNISVFPNPVQDELNIQFDISESKDFLLEIQDVTGRIFMQEPYNNMNSGDLVIINTSEFVSGVYFLRILTTDFKQNKVFNLIKL